MRISDWSSDVCSSDLGTPTRIFKSFFKAEPDLATLPGAHRSPCRSFRFQGNALSELALAGMLKLIVVGAGALSKMKTKRAAQPSDIMFVDTLRSSRGRTASSFVK